jgi:hypothetical protein
LREVLHFARIDASIQYRGNTTLYVGGKLQGEVPCLAICKYRDHNDVLLFHCDNDWNSQGVSLHATVSEAMVWSPSGKEHTIYVVACGEGWRGNECVSDLSATQRITYMARGGDSRVIYWSDTDNGGPYEISNCAIRNVENWRCSYQITDSFSSVTRMRDGKLVGDSTPVPYPQVSWWRWHLLQWGVATRLLRTADH